MKWKPLYVKMQGCGLEEIFSEITGRNTVQHILTGKAYSTAVQAHLINNIADCPDGKTTTNTFFETKLVRDYELG